MILLERLRIDQKKTQQQMANILGMSLRGYRKIENKESSPGYEATVSLQNYFNERIDVLLSDFHETSYQNNSA